MHLRVLAFASAAEALGTPELDLDLEMDDGTPTVADLKTELTRRHPRVRELWARLAVSVDGEIASDAEPLTENAEVALLPPVSGG